MKFFDSSIEKIALIFNGHITYTSNKSTHKKLIEDKIGYEFPTAVYYEDFVSEINPIFLYFMPNDTVIYSTYEYIDEVNIIEMLSIFEVKYKFLYKKDIFDIGLSGNTFSKININLIEDGELINV